MDVEDNIATLSEVFELQDTDELQKAEEKYLSTVMKPQEGTNNIRLPIKNKLRGSDKYPTSRVQGKTLQ